MLVNILATLGIVMVIAPVIWSYWKIKNLQKTIHEGYYMETVEKWMKNLQETKEFLDKQ